MCRFSKYTGAGNDFVLVRAEEVGLADAPALARRMCPRAAGVGVDGLILVRSLSEDRIRVRFLNPDGTEYGTCGNGSRCAARYAVERGLVSSREFGIVTDDGEVGARVDAEVVFLGYRIEAWIDRPVEIDLGGVARRGWLVRIGTPHLVIPVDALPGEAFEEQARPLRFDPGLGPDGANVDLVRPAGPDAAEIRTFERGVEAETLACGSGAMAAALVLRETGLAGDRLSLRTRSGATLVVDLEPADVPWPPGTAGGPEEVNGGPEEPAVAPADEPSRRRRTIGLAGPAAHIFDGVFPDAPA